MAKKPALSDFKVQVKAELEADPLSCPLTAPPIPHRHRLFHSLVRPVLSFPFRPDSEVRSLPYSSKSSVACVTFPPRSTAVRLPVLPS